MNTTPRSLYSRITVSGLLIQATACVALFFACAPSKPITHTVDVAPLVEQGQYEEAILILNETLAENPSQPDLLYNLACIYRLRNDRTTAKTIALKALSLNPTDDGILLFLVELSLDAGNLEEAWDRLSRLSDEGKKNKNAQLLLGTVHSQMANWIEAESSFRAALEFGASPAHAKSALAFVMIKLGQIDECKRLLQEADSEKEKSETALRQIAETYLALGQAQEARQIAYSLHPEKQNDAQLWSIIGRAELLLLSFGEAESTFTRAIACPNASPWNLVEYAAMLFAAKREDEALQKAMEAEEKLTLQSDEIRNPALFNLLATLYARRGQILLAQEYLQRSMQIDFNQIKVKELLDQIYSITASAPPQDTMPTEAP